MQFKSNIEINRRVTPDISLIYSLHGSQQFLQRMLGSTTWNQIAV
jgi:hypothetical protein